MNGTLAPGRYYVDSNVFIYAVENQTRFARAAQHVLKILETSGYPTFTSELALAETLVKPVRDQDAGQIALYEGLLRTSRWLTVVQVDRDVLRTAAVLRATQKQRLPDAIHLATATKVGCDVFVSQDARIRPTASITRLSLDTISPSTP